MNPQETEGWHENASQMEEAMTLKEVDRLHDDRNMTETIAKLEAENARLRSERKQYIRADVLLRWIEQEMQSRRNIVIRLRDICAARASRREG